MCTYVYCQGSRIFFVCMIVATLSECIEPLSHEKNENMLSMVPEWIQHILDLVIRLISSIVLLRHWLLLQWKCVCKFMVVVFDNLDFSYRICQPLASF